MKRRMVDATVEATEQNEIRITQADPQGNDDGIIVISPDQVDIVTEWLQLAKQEIEARQRMAKKLA